MSCSECGARCDYCQPLREEPERDHETCLCGCGASLRGMRIVAKFAKPWHSTNLRRREQRRQRRQQLRSVG